MLNATIKKLQYKLQPEVLIVDAPEEFEEILTDWERMATVQTGPVRGKTFNFAMIFVKSVKGASAAAKKYLKSLEPDAVLWMVYPKKSSKKYTSDITRDSGWETFGEMGYEGVSMVSVDEDWSAFRLRKVDFIKSLSRREAMAMGSAGKSKVKSQKNKK